MTRTLTRDDMVTWLRTYAADMVEQKAYLTELDSAVGDADHGINMARGMTAVLGKLDSAPSSTLGELFKGVGMTLVTSVGGASGPLYGTFFLRLGTALGDAETTDGAGFAAALRAGLDGIVARGKAERGDKTLVDAAAPAIDAFEAALGSGGDVVAAAAAAATAAAAGREATKPLVARKGRASYLGERSAGHIDPGSASTAALFGDLAAALASEPA